MPGTRTVALTPALALALALAPAGTPALRGQAVQAAAAGPHASAPALQAVRAPGPIQLDGRLDEPDWADAPPATDFTQLDPREGEPASERSEVRILFDDEALYIGARLYDSGKVTSRLGRRDASLGNSDWLLITLDTYHDHLTGIRLQVYPSGTHGDELLSSEFFGDDSWDPVWTVQTMVDDSGWVAELRVPFSQLRFSAAHEQIWGIQIARWIHRLQEYSVFSFTPKKERGGIARFGHLVGLEGIRPGRRLEVLPYSVLRAEYVHVPERTDIGFTNPFRDGSDYFGAAGVDVKYRLASNLTLDATINPDFGQVEVDPAVVNLSAFETFFQEKRPFFIEGANIFNFGGGGDYICFGCGQLFYSRRIGRPPRGTVPSDAAYGDLPEATTILGAAKITGKTASGWSVGLMEALTAREHADYVRTDGERGDTVVEPLANYFVGRARRDLRSGQTAVGAMLTAVNRRLDGTGLEHLLRSSAYAGGFDFKHEWAQRNWSLRGSLALSRISGSREVIEAAQRSSARYYQRPDADKLSPDTTATKLEGYAANLDLDKQAGLHWRGGIRLSTTSPGYEVNDLGFQTVADRHTAQAFLVYVEQRPGKRFRNWNLNPGVRFEWNYDGDLVDAQPYFSAFGLFANYWAGNVYLSRGLETLNDRRTRGGPLTRDPGSTSVSSFIGSDTRKKIKLNAFGYYAWSESGGHSYSVGPGLNIVPTANWSLSLTPRLFRSRTIAQYVQSVADATATETYGRRYIFADLAQTTLALETRLNLTFSPRFTLQLYAQPFLASGDYGHPKELAAPRSFEFHEYGRDAGTAQEVRGNDGSLQGFTVDPDGVGPAEGFFVPSLDFNFRSLRGNAVLRWEWRPGSTLFLVWQQRRSDYVPYLGDFRFGRDLEGLAHADDDNIFLLKINYWLNP